MNGQVAAENSEAAILARVFEEHQVLTPDAARYLVSMRLPSEDEARVNELSAKAQEGTLTELESLEIDNYLHIGALLSVVQSKARRFLRNLDQNTLNQ